MYMIPKLTNQCWCCGKCRIVQYGFAIHPGSIGCHTAHAPYPCYGQEIEVECGNMPCARR
eukprot:scaffold247543_cov32-Tisochrysis_lutea.AAC.2